jgi:hypothetical protein
MNGCTSQGIAAVLPQFAAAVVDSVELGGDLATFRVRAKARDAACPGCRRRSARVHDRRHLASLIGREMPKFITLMSPLLC